MSGDMRALGELPAYVANDSKIVACRRMTDMQNKLDMLRGFGFSCEVERHAKHWLIHYRFPRLRLVGGRILG